MFNALKGAEKANLMPSQLSQFPIAVWVPNVLEDYSTWAAAGVEHFWYNEGINPGAMSAAEAQAKLPAGVGIWRYPGPKMKLPVVDAGLSAPTALSLIDEPVMHGWTPQQWQAQADEWRKLLPGYPIVGNLEGDKFTTPTPSPALLAQYTAFCAAADVIFSDWYPINRIRYTLDPKTNQRTGEWVNYPIIHIGTATEFLVNITKGQKIIGAVIETSNQGLDLNSRAPTVDEFLAEIWTAVIFGARAIAYFPQRPKASSKNPVAGTVNNGTTPEIMAVMPRINYTLKALAPIFATGGERIKANLSNGVIARKWELNGVTYHAALNLGSAPVQMFPLDTLLPLEMSWYIGGKWAWSGFIPAAPPTVPVPPTPKDDLTTVVKLLGDLAALVKAQTQTIAQLAEKFDKVYK